MAPWKTASSSCHSSLASFNQSAYPRFFHFNPHLNRVVHQHATLADLLALPEGKLGYAIGSFVRNPYDRAYSGFLQIQRDVENQSRLHFETEWIGALVKTQIATNMSRLISAGLDFNKWIQILPAHEVFEPGHNTNMVLHPCHYWTHVNGEQKVGFVGKVEQFDADFERFCDFVAIEQPAIQVANVSTGQVQQATGESRYAARMSRAALDRINELFALDFDYFGYTMV